MQWNRRILEVGVFAALSFVGLSQETRRVSLTASGGQLSDNSGRGVVSADGRYVVFTTDAADVIQGDTNGVTDVFMYDRALGMTERVSIGTGGVESNGRSSGYGGATVGCSSDGRFVVFDSEGDNLVPGDSNGTLDVFVRDRLLGTTERVSVSSDGTEGNSSSWICSISADGRYVSFLSDADNLVGNDTNGFGDIFVHDRQTGTTIRASVASDGTQANHANFNSSISGDGRFVAFTSWASNLGLIKQNGLYGYDVYVHDCWTGSTQGVSVDASGNGGGGDRDSEFPRISADGRYVAFQTLAFNLLPTYLESRGQVLVRDLVDGTASAASRNSSGVLGGGAYCSISADGRYVAFEGNSNNYAQSGNPYAPNIYVRDRLLGTVDGASVSSSSMPSDEGGYKPTVTDDGRWVAYESVSTNLVPDDTNGALDVYLRDRGPASVTALCFGDGTGAPCPCANSGEPFRGCQNSASTGGAILWATGVPSLSTDTLRITSYGVRYSALTVLVQSDAWIDPVNYGDGLRCLGPSLKRLYSKQATRGIAIAPQGAEPSISSRSAALGDPIAAGTTRYYQTFYRDPAETWCPMPTGSTFNVSNAIAAVWDP